jgi:outer membrane lipopolysaccharide assembly protein LptE/RlpB
MSTITGIRNPRALARNLCAVLALCVLAGCGFHLRNQSALPTAVALRYQLKNSDTTIATNAAKANYRLMLLEEGHEQRIISLDRRGLAAEYGLISTVEFELFDRANRRVLGPLKLQELRTVTNNPDNALTTSQEITLVQSDINKALAAQLARRLGAYARHMTPAPAPASPEAPPTETPAAEPLPSTAPLQPPSAL